MTQRGQVSGRPFLIWLVAISTLLALIGGFDVLGYGASGYAWVVPLTFALLDLPLNRGRVTFPIALWIPWSALVLAYLVFADSDHALQRSAMLLCPLLIGVAISRTRATNSHLLAFRRAYTALAIALWAVVLVNTGMLLTGTLPAATGLAAPVMTAALLGTLFVANYALGNKSDIAWWGALAIVPVIALTRMGIVASALSLPLTCAPLKLKVRVSALALVLVAVYGLFQSDRVQQKMFYSGSGTFEDIARDNPDFQTTGRTLIWDAMLSEIEAKPWFGHGANASEHFVSMLTGGLTHPHNDWLRLLYDYGYAGTILFAATILGQFLHLLSKARRSSGHARVLFSAGASSFLVFSLFMLTDNVILYAAFFGNLQFTIIGLAYAVGAADDARPR